MMIEKFYQVCVFNDGTGEVINDFIVRFKGVAKRTFRINAEDLLLLIPGQMICSKCGRVKIKMIDLKHIEVEDVEKVNYSGFHEMREEVRKQLRRRAVLRNQIEEINRKIAIPELKEYLNLEVGERRGFSLYFRERFPVDSRERFDNSIGKLFQTYQHEFEREYVPKEDVRYYRTEFRTRYRGWEDSYVYPIEIPYVQKDAKYWAKAAICTMNELGLMV